MTTTIEITAAEIVAGDFLHRVKQAPLSRVFEDAIDERVLTVSTTIHAGKVTVALDGPYNSVLNLAPDRVVWVVRDENVEA